MSVSDWPTRVCARLREDGAVVRVVLADVLGSAPREPGAWMLVTEQAVEGTIGGGNLEWQAISAARSLLNALPESPSVVVRRVTLARDVAQCCGGVVQLWMERFTHADLPLLHRAAEAASNAIPVVMETAVEPSGVARSLARTHEPDSKRVTFTSPDESHAIFVERIDSAQTPLYLYGAGHVGQALVRVLSDLPFEITWVDSRRELFPTAMPAHARVACMYDPLAAAGNAPRSARHVVMTHDHGLDYELCRAILMRNTFDWLGLIGSASKAARFRSRLARDAVPRERIARLVCPIGMTDIPSKLPAAIAIGIAAQLLRAPAIEDHASTVEDCSAESCASCRSVVRSLL